MGTWPGGSCWSFFCCVAVLGVITLKPEATSMLSLFCVLLVVEQPAVNANRAMTLIMLNEVRICFIFVPRCFGLIWFQRSFGYKAFLISSFFVSRLSLSCHTFVTLRNVDALERANLSSRPRLTRVTLTLRFSFVALRSWTRTMPIYPPHGVAPPKSATVKMRSLAF